MDGQPTTDLEFTGSISANRKKYRAWVGCLPYANLTEM